VYNIEIQYSSLGLCPSCNRLCFLLQARST